MSNKRIIITGPDSMIGKAIRKEAEEKGHVVYPVTHSEHDLCSYDETASVFKETSPDYCIHLASLNGNISFNNKYPSDIFYTTSQIGLNVLNCCQRFGVKKVVSLISSCAYPDTGGLLKERNFWDGEPNPTVDAHGFSKRLLLEYSRQLYKQHGLVSVGVVVNTCYGPHDNFDINKTKVMGGLIKRFIDAEKNEDPEVFIYSDDVGKHTVGVLEKYNDPNYPINIGCGKDVSIKELAEMIKQEVGYQGSLIWDDSRPDGQMRKLLDNTKMKRHFGELSFTPLHAGIHKTIKWYKEYGSVDSNS